MKTRKQKLALILTLALTTFGAHAQGAQHDTAETCCLAGEWFAPLTTISAQSEDTYCCLANEWAAAPPAPDANERAVQSNAEEGCCLAREWNAS